MGYNFVETNKRKMDEFPGKLAMYIKDRRLPKPKRPTASIQSDMWREVGMQPKLLVLDEAQAVNKPALAWSRAVRSLDAKRVLVMSGTLPHNQWSDMYG